MPVYEYRCKACGRTFEIEHGFHDERPTQCPECHGPLVRIFAPVGVVFKGSGFHKTDYGRSGARPTDSKAKTDAPKADAPKSDGASKSAGESTSVPTPKTDSAKTP